MVLRPLLPQDVASRAAPPSVRYTAAYAALMQGALIGLSFAPSVPLVLPMCLLFFVTAYATWRYCLLYVYERAYESGGRMWPVVLGQVGARGGGRGRVAGQGTGLPLLQAATVCKASALYRLPCGGSSAYAHRAFERLKWYGDAVHAHMRRGGRDMPPSVRTDAHSRFEPLQLQGL